MHFEQKGASLSGDNLTPEEIDAWYRDEAEGYYSLYGDIAAGDQYPYHHVHKAYGFSVLPLIPKNALALGGGNGEDLLPVADSLESLTIVEASDSYSIKVLPIEPVRIKASASGKLAIEDSSFDLVTVFGVLHHIPNVTYVLSELVRCLQPGGIMLVREPTHSMGDSAAPRPGLTIRERGIPLEYLDDQFRLHNLKVLSKKRFLFKGSPKCARLLGIPASFADRRFVALDGFLSSLFAWNYSYDIRTVLDRFQPICVFYVLQKAPLETTAAPTIE